MFAGAKKNLKVLNSKRKAHLYHAKSNKGASRALKYVESEKGPLAPKLKEKCNDYASSVLKDVRYAPWLYVYSAVSGKFCEGWLPSNYWGYVVVPRIQGVHGRISELKSMNHVFFESGLFPDLVSYVNGTLVTAESEVISAGNVKDVLFYSSSKVVFKPDNSWRGRGIRIYEKESFDPILMKDMGSGVFQRFIDQDEGLASFFPSAVSTLRLTTAINKRGAAELRGAHLRFGTGSDTYVGHSTQIRVPMCMSTGLLSDFGYTTQWVEAFHHPYSKKKFSGFNYPEFNKAIEVVTRLHEKVPFIKCVGWDVCVDKAGDVNIIEWNGRQNDIQFPEATQGPCFVGLGW